MKYFAALLQPIVLLITLFIAVLLMNLLGLTIPITMINTSQSTELSVVGEGTVEVVPNTGVVTAGITVENEPDAAAAETAITQTNNAILDAMTQLGIQKENIETTQFNVQPSYSYESGQREIVGYNGTAQVKITAEEEGQIEEVIQAATNAGANEILDTQFEIGDISQYREQARDKAIEDAKQQAEKLSSELGIRLGKVTNFVESQPQTPYQPYARGFGAADMAVAESAPRPEIEAGSQEVTSTVTLFFEIK
jgi:hypothetical protein